MSIKVGDLIRCSGERCKCNQEVVQVVSIEETELYAVDVDGNSGGYARTKIQKLTPEETILYQLRRKV